MITMISGEGIADLASLAQALDGPTDLERIPIVPATHLLTEITAKGRRVADLRCGHGANSFNQCLATRPEKGGPGDVGELRQSTYLQYLALLLDVIKPGYRFDIDNGIRIVCKIFSLED